MASEPLDTLQIKIDANATKASSAVDRLIEKVDKLQTSVSRIDASRLNGLANGIQKLGNSMQSMKNVSKADFNRLASSLSALNAVDTNKLAQLSIGLRGVSSSLGTLGNIGNSAKDIAEIANGIKQLGYKSSDKAVTNIPKLAVAMRQLMTELSKAPVVSRNVIDMTNALAQLARTGTTGGRTASALANNFERISTSAKLATPSLNKLSRTLMGLKGSFASILGAFGGVYAIFRGIKESINISSDLTEVQNVVDVTFGDFKQKIEDLADVSIPELGMSELTTKQVASRFQAMGTAMGFSQEKMADMAVELTRLTGDMASFYNVEQKAVGEDLEAIFTGQTKPLRQYGLDLTEATLQEWALNNGINANINSMSQAEKTMLRYQYVMQNTGAAQGDFLRTADTWANQVRVLKEQFRQLGQIVGQVFINALKPLVRALNEAMGHIINFANVISNALGKIFGWKYEESDGGYTSDLEDMADSAEDLAGGTGKAADNVKKLKQQLQGFDELNVLTSDLADNLGKAGGSGGNLGGGGVARASGGQWVKDDQERFFESDIDTLRKLGQKISSTLIDTMQGIKWDKIYEKARNFGTGLASFLNGMFDGHNGTTLFGTVGETLAKTLNTVIYAALEFGREFDFKQFGTNIADGINKFFDNFDFASLAETIDLWVDGIKDTIVTIVEETDWKDILDGAKEFLENLDIDTIALIVGTIMIKKVIKTGIAKVALSKIGTDISKKIVTAIASKLGVDATWSSVATAIGTSLSSALTSLGGIGGLLSMDIGTILGAGTLAEIGVLIGGAIIGGIVSAFIGWNVGQWLYETISGEEIDMTFKEQMSSIFESFKDGSWSEALKLWRDDIAMNLAQMTVDIQSKFDEIKTVCVTKISSIKDKVSEKWKSLKEDIAGANALIKEDFEKKFNEISDKAEDWFTNDVQPWFTKEKWSNLAKNIGDGIKNKWNEFTLWWSQTGIGKWYNEKVKPWFERDKWSFSGLKDGIVSAWNSAISAMKQYWNNFANSLNQILKIQIKPLIIGGKTIFSGGMLDLGHIPTFAQGGFPEDGWFRASKGEMLGKFDDGRSVVANNNQITEGISSAVQRGNQQMVAYMQQEITELRRQSDFLMEIASKSFGITKEEIGQSARSWAMEYTARTGNEAYVF